MKTQFRCAHTFWFGWKIKMWIMNLNKMLQTGVCFVSLVFGDFAMSLLFLSCLSEITSDWYCFSFSFEWFDFLFVFICKTKHFQKTSFFFMKLLHSAGVVDVCWSRIVFLCSSISFCLLFLFSFAVFGTITLLGHNFCSFSFCSCVVLFLLIFSKFFFLVN